MRTLVADDEPPRRPGATSASVSTTTAGMVTGYSLTVPAPPPSTEPIVMVGVAVETIRPGDAAELVVEPGTGRGIVRRRRG